MTYRDAVTASIAQEMARDDAVVLVGAGVGAAGGAFGTTVGLLEKFGPERVVDAPVSEEAILSAAVGAATTGLRPIAEIVLADSVTVCHDLLVNEVATLRRAASCRPAVPLVVRSAGGGRSGPPQAQRIEAWAAAVPGLKVVAPSTPRDVFGLLAAAVRDNDPVVFLEHEALYTASGDVPDGELHEVLGTAVRRRVGKHVTIVALAATVPRALEAAAALAEEGAEAEVIDLRSVVPWDLAAVATSVVKTGRLVTVEEGPLRGGWGAEVASVVADECLFDLDGPIVRVAGPLRSPATGASAGDGTLSVARIVDAARRSIA